MTPFHLKFPVWLTVLGSTLCTKKVCRIVETCHSLMVGVMHSLLLLFIFGKRVHSFVRVRIYIHRASLIVWVSVVLRGTVVGSND